jgi:carbonic anhydrase/acetyltransferase-like protein (isoleucine patch superfamily)
MWLGLETLLLSGARIGPDSFVGARSVVTKETPGHLRERRLAGETSPQGRDVDERRPDIEAK